MNIGRKSGVFEAPKPENGPKSTEIGHFLRSRQLHRRVVHLPGLQAHAREAALEGVLDARGGAQVVGLEARAVLPLPDLLGST